MAKSEYTRLTRARLRSRFAVAITSRSSLWLGPDHLLVIDTSGYTETYKRFYFRDIQAFTIAASQVRLAWNWILGALTTACLVIWGAYFASSGLGMASSITAFCTVALFAVPLLLNNLWGPTCTCHLRTAVQSEQLCPLSRLRKARRVLDELRPFVLAAQNSSRAEATVPARESTAQSPVPAGPLESEAAPFDEIPPRINS